MVGSAESGGGGWRGRSVVGTLSFGREARSVLLTRGDSGEEKRVTDLMETEGHRTWSWSFSSRGTEARRMGFKMGEFGGAAGRGAAAPSGGIAARWQRHVSATLRAGGDSLLHELPDERHGRKTGPRLGEECNRILSRPPERSSCCPLMASPLAVMR